MIMIRLATVEDFRAWCGRDPDPRWCEQWYGFMAEQDGRMIGIAVVSRDKWGRIWVWSDMREQISAFLLHRTVRDHFAGLHDAGVARLHAYCSDRVPGAQRWLTRLGFRPDPTMPNYLGREVMTCDLSK